MQRKIIAPAGPSALELSGLGYTGPLTVEQRLAEVHSLLQASEMTPDDLRERRVELGYTQTSLAKALKAHPQSVSNWERFGPVPQDVARVMHTLPYESALTQALSKLQPGEIYKVTDADWIRTGDRDRDEAAVRVLFKKFKAPPIKHMTFEFNILVPGDPAQGFGIKRRW